jgi:hypothetical protein
VGRELTLSFDATITVNDSATAKLAGNFSATPDDVLRLICNGSEWLEVSRSAN